MLSSISSQSKALIIGAAVAGITLFLCLCMAVWVVITSDYGNTPRYTADANNTPENSNLSGVQIESDQLVDFKSGYNVGSVWLGSMTESKRTFTKKMHATYTFEFSYELNDPDRIITRVELTDISASTSLPRGVLKILPFAHVSYSQNGGSIQSTQQYEDWNTYGYTYVADYSTMNTLGDSYSPTICAEDKICDYLDQVGEKGGKIGLRFKYIDLGPSITENPEYQSIHVLDAFGLEPAALSGSFSWTLTITLDDGTVESKQYSVGINGDSLDLNSSNTSFINF